MLGRARHVLVTRTARHFANAIHFEIVAKPVLQVLAGALVERLGARFPRDAPACERSNQLIYEHPCMVCDFKISACGRTTTVQFKYTYSVFLILRSDRVGRQMLTSTCSCQPLS